MATSFQTWQRALDAQLASGPDDDPDGVVALVDGDFVLQAVSDQAPAIFGLDADDVIGASALELIHPADLERALMAFGEVTTRAGLRPPDVYRIRQGDGSYIAFDVSGESLVDPSELIEPGTTDEGSVRQAVVFRLSGLTERRRAEMLAVEQVEILERLAAGQSPAESLLDLANMSDRNIDGSICVIYGINDAGQLVPRTASALPSSILHRAHAEDAHDPPDSLGEALDRRLSVIEMDINTATGPSHWESVRPCLNELRIASCITTPAFRSDGTLVGFLEVFRSSDRRPSNAEMSVHTLIGRLMGLIADRHAFERDLSHAALSDPLTGLGNRRRMHLELEELTASGTPFGLLGIDVDQFSWINNNLGHAAGDELLIEVGRRILSGAVSTNITASVFRNGGDEFVVVLPGERRSEALLETAQAILQHMEPAVAVAATERRVNLSIGVARSDEDADPARVLARADAAMYATKRDGGAGVRLFSEPIGREMMRRMSLADELSAAVENNELRLVFQPIFDLHTQKITGVESLVRWEHPRLGLLGPGEFIPIAEESNAILDIDHWVLRNAHRQLERWANRQEADRDFEVWVNLSARSFVRTDLPGIIDSFPSLPRTKRLGLELTERDEIEDIDAARAAFAELRRTDVGLAIDDFGTGRASLAVLAELDVTAVKIDRTFVSKVLTNERYRSLTEMIVRLASDFGLSVTAEGIEDEETIAHLRALGCGRGQGFLLSRPMVPADFDKRFGPDLGRVWTSGPSAGFSGGRNG